jgi:hypothetical protein
MCAAIFLIAVSVRVLHWQDNRQALPFAGMAEEYQAHALLLVNGDLRHFLTGPNPPSDANVVKHPLGYPILLAALFKIFGQSDTALLWFNIVLDAVAALLVFFLAAELFPTLVAFIAGLLVAFSPQLAYHSIAPLPDPLVASPILLAILLVVRAVKRPRLWPLAAAGASIGVSCLFRSNALLLAPFLALLLPFLFQRGQRLRSAVVLVGAACLVMLPNTIRNVVVFRSFIPLSVSAGITLVEGIGIYDHAHRFGLPDNDCAVTKWEAEAFGRPDYLGTRFTPDGIKREQWRIAQGLAVVRAHPFWFAGVMFDRAAFMLRLARVEKVAAEPAVTHALVVTDDERPVAVVGPKDLAAAPPNAQTQLALAPDSQTLRFTSEGAADVLLSPPLNLKRNTDYLLRLPLKLSAGSVVVAVRDAERNSLLAETSILHPISYTCFDLTPTSQPTVLLQRPFVSGDADHVRVVLRNGDRKAARVVAEVGRMEVFELRPAAQTWTRYPRIFVRGVQSLFLTACVLPFIIIGAVALLRARCMRALALLVAVPVYYMCVQSLLWTEFRYILALHYFLLILTAVGLHWTAMTLWQQARRIKNH